MKDPHDHSTIEMFRKVGERMLDSLSNGTLQDKLEASLGLLEYV